MNVWVDLCIGSLLFISALFTVLSRSPYAALISRGIMGLAAVLLYATMGAPDVALTEALIGTLLTMMLFVVTVRSSMSVRLGVVRDQDPLPRAHPLRRFCSNRQFSLRMVRMEDEQKLAAALKEGRVDAIYREDGALPLLERALPSGGIGSGPVLLLAEHCRWHEQALKPFFSDSDKLIRLSSPFRKVVH